jgi:16S rRNA (guanine966-N2)-methyltransferase
LRIISGIARGRRIDSPKGMDTRPTLDRVRESVFGIIQFQVAGSTVLDLFAGSGAMGLEALSRGARYAIFNDRSRVCTDIIQGNIKTLGFEERARVYGLDFRGTIDVLAAAKQKVDIVFIDPPYLSGLAQAAADLIFQSGILTDTGIVVAEHSPKYDIVAPDCSVKRPTRIYGSVAVSIFERGC